jgi:hypothetical protein
MLRKGMKTTTTPEVMEALAAWKVAFRARVQLSGVYPMALHAAVFGDITKMKVPADSNITKKDLEGLWHACFYVMFVTDNDSFDHLVPCSGDHGITLYNAATVAQAEMVWGSALQNHQENARKEMEKSA